MTLSIICALTENNAIGLNGALLYHLPSDLRHFKALTTGHAVIMGRKTFESLPKGALPNRRNLVITRQAGFTAPGIEVFHNLDDAIAACKDDDEAFVIGGGSIYAAALPLAGRLCLTRIHATPQEADTFFPPCDTAEWELESEEHHNPDERNRQSYTFACYRRKEPSHSQPQHFK